VFNIAVSFVTNANWRAHAGEMMLSHLSQMVGLEANNFLDSAAATAIAVALIRALIRNESTTIGNFWVDMARQEDACLAVEFCGFLMHVVPIPSRFLMRVGPSWPQSGKVPKVSFQTSQAR
jgi:K+-transporting ATPase A subunit